MKNLGVIYTSGVFLFLSSFLLLWPIFVLTLYKSQSVAVVIISLFYGSMAAAAIIDRKRFMMTFLCLSGVSDHLLVKKAISVFGDKILHDFGGKPIRKISEILKEQIIKKRKRGVAAGSLAQKTIDHLIKNLTERTCKPTRILDLHMETILEMRNNPDVSPEERLEGTFKSEAEAREEIKSLNKEIYFYLFMAEASGLRVWPHIEGYINQKLSRL